MNAEKAETLQEEIAEKQRDYRKVVITQAIIIMAALLLEDFLELVGFHQQRQIFFSIFLLLGGIYYYMLWDLLKNFTHRPGVLRTILVLLIADFILLALVEFPFFEIFMEPRPYLICIHSVLFLTEVCVMYHVFKDIFGRSAVSFDKLWGSVCLFLMMGIAFASIYDIISFIEPNCFGVPLEAGFPSFVESLYYSLVTIGGGAPSFPNVSHLVRNIAAIEGVWGTLYLVILIGRIIGRV